MNYYLAIDLGASSGRHILGKYADNKPVIEELHRFQNGAVRIENNLCWEIDRLFDEIKNGLKKCAEAKKIPVSIGIDTWGVDFVLIDKDGKRIGNAVSYRDAGTENAMPYVHSLISEADLYSRTGIQCQSFNTIYQLSALKMYNPTALETAEHMLLLPDYFNYLLTGRIMTEYTNATTTGLINAKTGNWDDEIIERLGLPRRIFSEIYRPATVVGQMKSDIADEIGFNADVVMTASHDTASAIMAVPEESKDGIYISSGTWSLMGIRTENADCSQRCRELGLSNEGGFDGINCLKNIMGLWMIQQVRHEYDDKYSFAQLCEMAEKSEIDSVVDCDSEEFLSPESMCGAIDKYCSDKNMQLPRSPGDYSKIIYTSLARCYADCAKRLEELTGKRYDCIQIIGGGSNAGYLNMLTERFSKKTVCAGPSEATAIGNITAQKLAFDKRN